MKREEPERSVTLYTYKTKRVLKTPYKLLLMGLVCVALVLAIRPLLVGMGSFLHLPTVETICDAILVEAGPSISEYYMKQAIEALQCGKARHLIVVLRSYDLNPAIFGIDHYDHYVGAALDSLGLGDHEYTIYKIAVNDPYTYNTARVLADSLSHIRTLYICNDSFHIRRSYMTFVKVLQDIKVYPYTIDIYIDPKSWYTSLNGWRRVMDEYVKLAYYKINGYI